MVTNFVFVIGLMMCCKCRCEETIQVPTVVISQTLNEVEITDVKRSVKDADVNKKEDWNTAFEMESDGLYEFIKLGIERRAKLAKIEPKILPVAFYTSFVGYGGGSVKLMRRLESEDYNIVSLTVLDNPKNKGPNDNRSDNEACKDTLRGTKVKVVRLINHLPGPEAAEEASYAELNLEHYKKLTIDKALVEIQSQEIKFLVVALTSAAFDSKEVKHQISLQLSKALSILPKLAPIRTDPLTNDDIEVMSPGSPNGRKANGTWLTYAKHTCTDVVETVWPLTSFANDSLASITTHYFVRVNPGQKWDGGKCTGKITTFLEAVKNMYSTNPNWKSDIDAVENSLANSPVVKLATKSD